MDDEDDDAGSFKSGLDDDRFSSTGPGGFDGDLDGDDDGRGSVDVENGEGSFADIGNLDARDGRMESAK